jgi:hypothetical protein
MSDTIIKRPEEIKELHHRFVTDKRIATLNNEIAALYSIAISQALIKKDGMVTLVYDKKTEYEVRRIRMIINDIVKNEYQELLQK